MTIYKTEGLIVHIYDAYALCYYLTLNKIIYKLYFDQFYLIFLSLNPLIP